MDTQAIIDNNPNVKRDQDTLDQALNVVRELRAVGTKPKGYNLVSPFERRRGGEARRVTIHTSDR